MGCWNYFQFDAVTGKDLVASSFASPRTLLIVRCIFFCWNCPILIYCLSTQWINSNNGNPALVYLTMQSYALINIYLLLCILVTYRERITYNRLQDYGYSLVESRPLVWWEVVFWVLFEVLATIAPLVTIVYWTMLYPEDSKNREITQWTNVHVHAVNSLVMITEFFMNRLHVLIKHIHFVLLFGAYYLTLHTLYYVDTGKWIYTILDTSKQFAWAFYIGIVVLSLVAYVILWRLTIIKERYLFPQINDRVYLPMSGYNSPNTHSPTSNRSDTPQSGKYVSPRTIRSTP